MVTAHEEVSGRRFARGDARPDNSMVCIKITAVLVLKLIDMGWAGVIEEATNPLPNHNK